VAGFGKVANTFGTVHWGREFKSGQPRHVLAVVATFDGAGGAVPIKRRRTGIIVISL
jgi:hypothetical protein